jgi:hypothetical protein
MKSIRQGRVYLLTCQSKGENNGKQKKFLENAGNGAGIGFRIGSGGM